MTLVIDAVGRCVVEVEEGREKETIARFSQKLKAKGGDTANITAVSSDMSKTYGPAIEENFPNAEHIIDKIHVKQVLTNAMEAVRKEEQRDVQHKRDLFRNRYLFMKAAKQADRRAGNFDRNAVEEIPQDRQGLSDRRQPRRLLGLAEHRRGGARVQAALLVDEALPPQADEGCRADPVTPPVENPRVLQGAPDERDM